MGAQAQLSLVERITEPGAAENRTKSTRWMTVSKAKLIATTSSDEQPARDSRGTLTDGRTYQHQPRCRCWTWWCGQARCRSWSQTAKRTNGRAANPVTGHQGKFSARDDRKAQIYAFISVDGSRCRSAARHVQQQRQTVHAAVSQCNLNQTQLEFEWGHTAYTGVSNARGVSVSLPALTWSRSTAHAMTGDRDISKQNYR